MRISDWSADVGSTDLVYQCAGQPLAFERTDKRSLRCASATGPVELIYRVYAFDESVRKAWLDSRRGFFNGSSLFYCPSGCEHAAFDVELLAPEDELAARWHVATTLPAVRTAARSEERLGGKGWVRTCQFRGSP